MQFLEKSNREYFYDLELSKAFLIGHKKHIKHNKKKK